MNRKTKIVEMLRSLGIPASLLGYEYLKTAINLCLERPELICKITGALYPEIAKVHSTSASRAERALRHAIETGRSRGNIDVQEKLFGYTVNRKSRKPTNGEFIAVVTEQIRMEESDND